jgi:heme-degrading monooxygenase HmoA
MLLRVWQFRVRSDKADEFRSVYGPAGAWAELFRRVAGFLGTELLQSTTEPDTYLTLDRWESAEAWAAFLQAHPEDYAALDQQCDSLTREEVEVGIFRNVEAAEEAQ